MKLSPDQKAGLYITAIIHLAVIIVLLTVQIGYALKAETSFVLDFTAQEEKEKEVAREELRKDALEKLEQLLAARPSAASGVPIRNVAVNVSSQLKDDRNTDADQLYKDAERLSRELKEGQNRPEDPEDYVPTEETKPQKEPEKKAEYHGPSVLAWQLDGRKASRLPIPAYRCIGAGEVTVVIGVNNQGDVVDAKVEDGVSSTDRCLRDYAVQAALKSRFSASTTAPAKQMGTITYAFIAQ